jgi:hypothetical protein
VGLALHFHKPSPHRPERSLGARAQTELAEDPGYVGPGRALADVELGGDLLVGLTRRHEAEHVQLAGCGGAQGIRKYCRPQSITATLLAPRSELLWYPYTALKGKLFLRVTRLLFARDLGRRLGRRRR